MNARGEPGLAVDVARAEPGVDEHEPVALGLDEQTVRDHLAATEAGVSLAEEPAGDRTHRGAVEVVDGADRHAPSLADYFAGTSLRSTSVDVLPQVTSRTFIVGRWFAVATVCSMATMRAGFAVMFDK